MRADAQRNLDRLLEAAAECFSEKGVDVSVAEIARRAGVGQGTVFRRFPTKDALLAAVLTKEMLQLSNTAMTAYSEPDAGKAFDYFVRNVAEAYARNHALIEAMKRCEATPEVDALVDAVARLLRRAQDAGAIRTDITATDVLALVPTASTYPEIVLDGLRPSAPARSPRD